MLETHLFWEETIPAETAGARGRWDFPIPGP
jgi:hypothetical protein